MTLHLDLSPQAEAALRAFAQSQGSSTATVVSALIEETFALSKAANRDGTDDWDTTLSGDDFAVLVDLLGPDFARCVAAGVLPSPCPDDSALGFPK